MAKAKVKAPREKTKGKAPKKAQGKAKTEKKRSGTNCRAYCQRLRERAEKADKAKDEATAALQQRISMTLEQIVDGIEKLDKRLDNIVRLRSRCPSDSD